MSRLKVVENSENIKKDKKIKMTHNFPKISAEILRQ